MTDKTYRIQEIFYSLQGEGLRSGEPSFFVRFSGCNMQCDIAPGPKSPGGFICDTEFSSGRNMTVEDIHKFMKELNTECKWIVLTGGEPGLQVDEFLVSSLKTFGYVLAIESNGTIKLPEGITHICISPKSAEHTLKQLTATEVKYVRRYGHAIPQPVIKAEHYYISPAFDPHGLDSKTLQWCVQLCLDNPTWKMSVQQHKEWNVR